MVIQENFFFRQVIQENREHEELRANATEAGMVMTFDGTQH
jgi:hypothetical protein